MIVITESTKSLIASKNTAVAAESPKTVFKISVTKRIADQQVYAGFYRRRWTSENAENTLSLETTRMAEIHKRDLTGRSFIGRLNGNDFDPARFSINHRKSPIKNCRIFSANIAPRLSEAA
jgi:hypothetical protein